MGHTYTNLLTHIVFSTKSRHPFLKKEQRQDVFAYMGGIVRELGGVALNINGPEDHVHLLVKLSATRPVAEAPNIVKTNSSRWIHETGILSRAFAWQEGYAAFSVSESSVENVVAYITNQEAHHLKLSFQEELIMFLKRHGIAYDERYIWK